MAEQNTDRARPFDSSDPVMRTATQFARLYKEVETVAASDPRFTSGAEKAKQGILEMQSALVTPRLMPRLEINIPMPAGVAVPRAPQSQSAAIPPAEPAQPAAAQSR
jgi:hypothetical protein